METSTRTEESDLARAEGEGMSFVPPPEVKKPKLALMHVRVQAQRLLAKLPPEQRNALVAGAIAVGVGSAAKRLRVHHLAALTLAAASGVAIGMFLQKQPEKLLPPAEVPR